MHYYRARYYDPSTGRFLQQDPDPGNLTSPNTFLSKYIYAANNPIMFADPSGRAPHVLLGAIIGAIVGAIIGAIDATVNGGNFLEKTFRGALGGALFGAAIALSHTAGITALLVSLTKASGRRENFFEAFNRDIITDGALSLAGAYAGNYLSEWAETSYLLESLVPKILGGIFAAGGLAIGIPYTINGILNSTCDIAKGGWVGSDICKSYDTANGN